MRRHRKQGRISPEQLTARLSRGALEMLEEKVDIGRWYPIQIFCELLDLDWELGGRGDPNYMREEGEQAAERLFQSGIYQQLSYAERVERVRARDALIRQAKLITTITGTLYNFLTFEVRLDADNGERAPDPLRQRRGIFRSPSLHDGGLHEPDQQATKVVCDNGPASACGPISWSLPSRCRGASTSGS